ACTQKTQERGERLLLREHTHSFFFNPACPEIEPSGSSWTSDQFYQKLNIELKGLVSVRDPVDSWLGFRKGFPLQLPRSFDEYCQRYNAYLDRIDQETKHKKNIYLFRYEDLIQDPQKVVDEIANHLNVAHCPVDYSAVGKHVGSGNSGRSSVALSQRPRRPYSLEFLKLASESNEYTKLCQRLGYPQLQDEISLLKKMKATYYSLLNPCLKPVEHLRSRSKKLKSLARGIGNIQ
ncbi:MAG: sulfotransferase domain-containing protein, partial [Pirellulaceae bacterium]|nr:sulfotransferase domain-containing protein [Pirellulaceae bacterium]